MPSLALRDGTADICRDAKFPGFWRKTWLVSALDASEIWPAALVSLPSVTMNEQEVDRQINQMVQFIKQEAEEKANEIRVAAEEEFNIEKLQMVETEKQRIRKEYERKESQVEVKKKIEYSTELNAMRLKVLAAREEAIQGMLAEARATVGAVSASPDKWNGSSRRAHASSLCTTSAAARSITL